MDDTPYIPKDLVEFLNKAFPNELPSNLLTLSDRAIGALHGQRTVVQFLEEHLAAQEEKHVST
jgi:hypothetical protein